MRSPPFPFRPLAVLLLALAAQTLLEPPARVLPALGLYLLAGGLAVWSFYRGEWNLPSPPLKSTLEKTQSFRLLLLLASIPLLERGVLLVWG